MLTILQRLENETPQGRPRLKIKPTVSKLTQRQITALQKQASQQAVVLTHKGKTAGRVTQKPALEALEVELPCENFTLGQTKNLNLIALSP